MAVFLIILAVVFVGVLFLYFKFFKIPKLNNYVFVDGTLGSGKSFYSVNLAIRLYKKQLRKAKFNRIVLRCFNFWKWKDKYKEIEDPVLYSNIRLRNVDFVVLSKQLLFRNSYRFAYGSVVLLDEMSLIADQMLFKDGALNERLTEFVKLFRHETKGGYLITNSQAIADIHFSFKYALSNFLYIHSAFNIPFFRILRVQESSYSADKGAVSSVNVNDGDLENSLKLVIVPKKYFKQYDSYCYSIFTDSLPVYKNIVRYGKGDSLKAETLVSFKEFKYLYENIKKKEKNEVKKDETKEK